MDAEKTYNWGQVSTIPAGYRPNVSFRIMATCGDEGAVVLASVETGGAIKLKGTVLRRAVVAFTAVYFTP